MRRLARSTASMISWATRTPIRLSSRRTKIASTTRGVSKSAPGFTINSINLVAALTMLCRSDRRIRHGSDEGVAGLADTPSRSTWQDGALVRRRALPAEAGHGSSKNVIFGGAVKKITSENHARFPLWSNRRSSQHCRARNLFFPKDLSPREGRYLLRSSPLNGHYRTTHFLHFPPL